MTPVITGNFDNNRADHRSALIDALKTEGFDAYEYHSGGGTMHVIVDLIPASDDYILQISSGSIDSPFDVGIMGWNEDGNVDGPDWIQAQTLSIAVNAFKIYFADREKWIRRFNAGELSN